MPLWQTFRLADSIKSIKINGQDLREKDFVLALGQVLQLQVIIESNDLVRYLKIELWLPTGVDLWWNHAAMYFDVFLTKPVEGQWKLGELRGTRG